LRARRKEEKRAEAFFPLFDCSLPLADRARKPPPLSSLADERRVGSLLRSTAARDPVRATTTAADSERAMREPLEYIAGNSGTNQRGSLKKVLLRPTVSASLNLPAVYQEMGNHDHR
jgi:hypothetical protein